ncbi:MAG: 16S rRNA (uracil(1498)-N(3))-methyltransferase [Flavobacteriales bacterium]|nr:16S rRNA (uracil(1498)-N(3))-methyltransferase [Flavobacteriales bacterium]
MPDFQLFYTSDIHSPEFFLDEQESKHLIRVLRKSTGDEVFFTDGKGSLFQCRIAVAHARKAVLEVVNVQQFPAPAFPLTVAIAPTKNIDRMEYFVEKAVEIGVHRIVPIRCDRSERKAIKTDRLQKIAVSAMKQSLKYHLPIVEELQTLDDYLASCPIPTFIAHLAEDGSSIPFLDAARRVQEAAVLIGPEGDFSPEELERIVARSVQMVSLGTSRLRTETAGIMAVATWNLVHG